MTAAELLAALDGGEVIPLAVLRGAIGWNRQAQRYAVQQGLIRPLPRRGPHGGYQITREDAIALLAAAALAPGAGVAVVTLLRAIDAAGISAQDLAGTVTGAASGQLTVYLPPGAVRSPAPWAPVLLSR